MKIDLSPNANVPEDNEKGNTITHVLVEKSMFLRLTVQPTQEQIFIGYQVMLSAEMLSNLPIVHWHKAWSWTLHCPVSVEPTMIY